MAAATVVTTPYIIVPIRYGRYNDRDWNDYREQLLTADEAEHWKVLPWSRKQGNFVFGVSNSKWFKTKEAAEAWAEAQTWCP